MKQFTRRVRRNGRAFFSSKTLVALIGLFLSVLFHELFHVIVHWGSIQKVQLFPDHAAIVAITSETFIGYNPQFEEFIAYSITMLTMLMTAVIVSRMHDRKDTRTALQIVFPRKKQQQMSTREFYEVASRINLI